jgi:transposase
MRRGDENNIKKTSTKPTPCLLAAAKQRWMEWLYHLERGEFCAVNMLPSEEQTLLFQSLSQSHGQQRRRVLIVLAKEQGFSQNQIAEFLGVSRNTVRTLIAKFQQGGTAGVLTRKAKARKADDEGLKNAVFELLHEPPSLSGINRTTWKSADFQRVLAGKGHTACSEVIRSILKEAGYRWKCARVVLTSTDPAYREKLATVQGILTNLHEQERFFSIDEFGPFAIKMKAGRALVPPGAHPTVPQWQKSKGWLILTGALELSRNQVSHFYSKAKNTNEMIRMVKVLIGEYKSASKLYISWDAASWHLSKELVTFIDRHNADATRYQLATIELAPLPASAQFLNVIESVFSGMARAIIHGSDYESTESAMAAMDKYFAERNQYFKENPRRAGKKIWGLERTSSDFAAANNCKDSTYR